MKFFYMQSTCSAHGPFFPERQGDPCPLCKIERERRRQAAEAAAKAEKAP